MRRRARVLFLIHQYTGFIFAAYLIVVCGSGALLVVLENQIAGFRDYPVLRVPQMPAKVSLAAMLSAAQRANPGRRVYHILESCPDGCTYDLSMHDGDNRLDVLVDPYTGRVARTIVWQRTPVGVLYALHGSLFAGDTGETINAAAGLSLVLLGGTGTLLWRKLPRLRWRPYEIHSTVGIAAVAFLFVFALTAAAQVFWPDTPAPAPVAAGAGERDLDSLVRAADAALPGELTMVYPPDRGVVMVRKRVPGDPDPYGYSYVAVNAATAAVVSVYDLRQFPLLQRARAAVYAIHIGSFGFVLRVVYAIAGFAPAVLFTTAFLMWLRKI